VVREIRGMMGDDPVYLSFDTDCLDPAFAPGTGTPVAGGMRTFDALKTLRGLKGLNIIGGDLVEVSPPMTRWESQPWQVPRSCSGSLPDR